MRILDIAGAGREELERRVWNPYLGVSINNKAFTAEYLEAYMRWAAPRAKERAAVLVVDVIQRINNEVFDRSKPVAAIERAFRKAGEVLALCRETASRLPDEMRERLVILEWPDIVQDDCFHHNLAVLKEAHGRDSDFRGLLTGITRRNLGAIVGRLDEGRIEALSQYLLYELPEIIAGFRHGGVHYNLNVYPGAMSKTYSELMESPCMRRLLPRLRFIGRVAHAETYRDDPPA